MSTLNPQQRETLLKIADKFFDHTYSKMVVKSSRSSTPASFLVLAFDKGDKMARAVKTVGADQSKIEQHLLNNSGLHPSHPLYNREDCVHVNLASASAPCHGGFPNDLEKYGDNVLVASNLEHFPKEGGYSYIKYLLDKEKSPFRKLLSFGYHVHYTDQHHSGISFFLSDIPIEYRGAIKSFFIACRLTREYPHVTQAFDILSEHFDPRVAHLLIGNTVAKKVGASKKYLGLTTYGCHTGGHWALSMSPYDWGLSVRRFFEGDLNVEAMSPSRRIAPFWMVLKRYGDSWANYNAYNNPSPEAKAKAWEQQEKYAMTSKKVNAPFAPNEGETEIEYKEWNEMVAKHKGKSATLFSPSFPDEINLSTLKKGVAEFLKAKGIEV